MARYESRCGSGLSCVGHRQAHFDPAGNLPALLNNAAMLRSLLRLPRPSQLRIARMSSRAQASPKYFFVYAPDKTEEGTFERRMSVRPKHLEVAHERTSQGLIRTLATTDTTRSAIHIWRSLGLGGGLLTPESIESPDAVKKLIGSTFIYQAESLDE